MAALDSLASVQMFSGLSKRELQRVAKASDEVHVAAGRDLTVQGQPGHEFYLILQGTAAVVRDGQEVATLGPGQYFGELVLLDKGVRNATVTAATEMDVLVLGQREFLGLLENLPAVSFKLLRSMAHRLREADERNVSH